MNRPKLKIKKKTKELMNEATVRNSVATYLILYSSPLLNPNTLSWQPLLELSLGFGFEV